MATSLAWRLGELGVGVRAGDEAAAGVEAQAVVGLDRGAAQRDAELAVAVRVDPADRSGVAAAVHALELADDGERALGRRAAHRRGRVQRRGEGEHRRAVGEDAR